MAQPPVFSDDFPVRSRRHFPNHNKSNLTLGFVPEPEKEAQVIPHHIPRSRVAHDAADMYLDPENFTSQTKKQESGPSHFTTTYMAQTQGLTEPKKATGKKQVQASSTGRGLGSIINSSGSLGPRRTPDDAAALQLGTTKASQHIPGYTGHVVSNPQARTQRVNERSIDKAEPLHIQNYKGPIPGYTGKRML